MWTAASEGMNEALIGEEVTLEAAPGEHLTRLVISAAGAFLEATTGASALDEAFADEVRTAVAGFAGQGERVRARLVVVEQGIEVHLSSGEAAGVVKTVTARG